MSIRRHQSLGTRSLVLGGSIGFSAGSLFLYLLLRSHPIPIEVALVLASSSYGFGFLGVAFSCYRPILGLFGLIGITIISACIQYNVSQVYCYDPIVGGWITSALFCFIGIAYLATHRPCAILIGMTGGILAIALHYGLEKTITHFMPLGHTRLIFVYIPELTISLLYVSLMTFTVWFVNKLSRCEWT